MWHRLTVAQFQKIHALQEQDIDPVDKVLQAVAIAFNLSDEEANALPVGKFNKYAKQVGECLTTPDFARRARRFIRAGGHQYRLTYNTDKLPFGQYIECQHFIGGGIVENLHLIAASISGQRRLWLWGVESSHDERAEDFKSANFRDVYCSVVFFCSALTAFNSRWQPPQPDEDEDETETPPFIERYGWIYSATQVAEHERLTLDAAFKLPTVQALNGLIYLRELNQYKHELNKKAAKQHATV